MAIADEGLWPLASSPERARWAAQAVERYLHMARIILSRAATWPAPRPPSRRRPWTSRGSSTRRSSVGSMTWAGPCARTSAAMQGLGTIGQLYAQQDAKKGQETQALFQLASTLGVLGLGGLAAFGGFGYAR